MDRRTFFTRHLGRRPARATLFMAIASILAGCGSDKPSEPDPVEPGPRTIDDVLNSLSTSYESRDFEAFSSLLDSRFLFVFDPVTLLDNHSVPPSWALADEMLATQGMFTSPEVQRIRLDFVRGRREAANPADEGRRAFPEGTMKVTLSELELSVMVESSNEEIVYQVTGDQAVLFLSPAIAASDTVWSLLEWRDRVIGSGATSSGQGRNRTVAIIDNSWGEIKAFFHPSGYANRGRIEGLFTNLELAYERRNSSVLEVLLDSRFLFELDPLDVLEYPDIPDEWNRFAEIRATESLFESDRVSSITLDLGPSVDVFPTIDDVGDREFPPGTRKVIASVNLAVEMQDETGTPTGSLQVSGGSSTFFVSRASFQSPWYIFEWRDFRPLDLVSTNPTRGGATSWGYVKSLFQNAY